MADYSNYNSWLNESRSRAWSIYQSTPTPTTKSEEWRYTDLSKLFPLENFGLEANPETSTKKPARESLTDPINTAGRVQFTGGLVTNIQLTPAMESQGVGLDSLQNTTHEKYQEIIQANLCSHILPPESGKFQALNAALWTDGIIIYVPKNVRIEMPIRGKHHLVDNNQVVCTRTLIIAEEGSHISYVEEFRSDDFNNKRFVSSAVEIIAQKNATVDFVSVQNLGRGIFFQAAQKSLVHRDASVNTLNVTLGASLSRLDLNTQLLEPGANSKLLGLYFGDENQHFDHNTSQDHLAPHTGSDLLYKGALDGSARAAFRGIIRVGREAQQTDAYQTNRTLLLSDKARADSLPNLEIEADDVRCSHGSTVGQLDPEAVFYLLSRGSSRQQAERLVVLGFLGDVLTRLPRGAFKRVVKNVTDAVEQKLHHG
ncbi:MAG: Fe-S cluster assembly protein SufD [bacterium]